VGDQPCQVPVLRTAAVISILLIGAVHAPQARRTGRNGEARAGRLIGAFQEPRPGPPAQTGMAGDGRHRPFVAAPCRRRIYLLSREGSRRSSPASTGNGKPIWRDATRRPTRSTQPPAARQGPKSTPVSRSGTLFTLGIGGILSAYDAEGGRLRWRREFASEYRRHRRLRRRHVAHRRARLLVAHVGGHDNGALCRLRRGDGKAGLELDGTGPATRSPIAADIGGTRQIVTQSQERIIACRR